jgi:hypothetical protein
MGKLTPEQQLNMLYTLSLTSGTCFDLDYGMRGTWEQEKAWKSAVGSAKKLRFAHPVARAREDHYYLITQLNNQSMPPWFVRVCQSIWNAYDANAKEYIIDEYCELCRKQLLVNPNWHVAPMITNVEHRQWQEPTYDPETQRTYKDLNFLYGPNPIAASQEHPRTGVKRPAEPLAGDPRGKGKGKGDGKGKGKGKGFFSGSKGGGKGKGKFTDEVYYGFHQQPGPWVPTLPGRG